MMKLKFVHWQDDGYFLGHLLDYPDYMTQAKTHGELIENLQDLYKDIASGEVSYIRKVDELIVALHLS